MFESYHPVHFLRHYLNTSVFGSLTQAQFPTQFSSLISGSIFSLYSLATTIVSCATVASVCRVKIDREQIHYYLGG